MRRVAAVAEFGSFDVTAMTLTLDTVQFIAPFAPPLQTAAEVKFSWESFRREFPQSVIRRLWARLYFGSSRAAAVIVRVINRSGEVRVAGCVLSWSSRSDTCLVRMRIDPVGFKVESGAQMEILRQSWI